MDTGHESPDPIADGVTRRHAAPARRARWTGITAAVALATATVGFAAGRSSAPEGANRIEPSSAADTTDDVTATTGATGAPSVSDAENESTATTAAGDTAAPGATPGDGVSEGDESAGSGAPGTGMLNLAAYEETLLEPVATRRMDDGTVLTVRGVRWPDTSPWGEEFPGWEPAGWCFSAGTLRVGIAAVDSVNVAWAPWYREPKDGLSATTFATGYAEGHPRFGVVAQVAADVTMVSFETPDGRDSVAPTPIDGGGIAVLLVPGPIATDFTIEFERAGTTTALGVDDMTAAWSDSEYREACDPPPPALPPAGQQPADPAAAEASVRDALAAVRADDIAARLAAVDDPTGLEDAWTSIAASDYADVAASAEFVIRELVFTSPTDAWFRYDIDTSIATFSARYGRAVEGEDGVWRITRQTVCQDLALAPGTTCAPPVDVLLPPSAADDPRYGGAIMEE